MVYIKFSNGATTQLINMNNEVAQSEAVENGFFMIVDENGVPEVVESDTLVKNKDKDRADMLEAIADKLGNKSKANQIKHGVDTGKVVTPKQEVVNKADVVDKDTAGTVNTL